MPELPSIRQRVELDAGHDTRESSRTTLHQLLRIAARVLAAVAGGYVLGCAAYFLELAWDATGMAGRAVAALVGHDLTATAPARFEQYHWVVEPIPEDDYHAGERIIAWPELVLAYEANDGRTRRLRVRGHPNNTYTIQTYMAYVAGVFGLPWIDYVLPDRVARRLSYDPGQPPGWSNQPPGSLPEAERARFGDTHETWLVASSTDRAVEQLAMMWAAPAPPLTVRYDPHDPADAYPAPLLDALSRPLSRDAVNWVEASLYAMIGAAVLWKLLAFLFRRRIPIAVSLWLVAIVSVPLWTPHIKIVADFLGVSRSMTAVFGRGVTNPVKLHRMEVEPLADAEPRRAIRWSLRPEEGATLLARLAPPPPGLRWSDLLTRDENWLGGAPGSGVAERFANEVRSALTALPDEELTVLLNGLCEPSRSNGFVYMLRPALEHLASDSARAPAVRARASALANNRAFCR